MDRRLLACALACWPVARLFAQEAQPRPHFKISAAELFDALSARFPVRLGVPGLLQLEVSAPQLHLLPARNKLGALLMVQAGGQALQQVQAGDLDVLFGLRYEAADRTIRAREPEIVQLRLPTLPRETVQSLQAMLREIAGETVGEIVLHRLTARELALPDTMGFAPDRLTVLEDGLLVEFAAKPVR